MKEKFLNKQLKFSLFIALFLVCVFALWFFVVNKTQQMPIKKSNDTNTSAQSDINLTLQDLQSAGNLTQSQVLSNLQPFKNSQNLENSQNLTTSQTLSKFAQKPEHNSTQTNTGEFAHEKKRVKGLFVDYDESELNASEFNAGDFKSEKIGIETNSSTILNANLSIHSNTSANLRAFDKTNSNTKLSVNSKVLSDINSSAKPNLSTLNEINASLIFDTGKTALLLMPTKHYVGFFDPLKKDYFRFLRFKKADKSADSKGAKRQKPKLCIIIDDMASREQVNALKATGLKLTPSFFPADNNHPKTPILAREFEFFMVHLPLMAVHYTYEERETLSPNDSQQRINAKIAQISRDFKGLKFINNHTGSLFTDDTQAMRRLFRALKAHNLIFVDSMTIGSSKGALVSKEFNQTPIKRDIFLDNENDINAIKAKIKEAVRKAHAKGFAIAIAHPKKNTFEALKQSKKLLQSVDLVYLSEIYENP